MRESQPYKRKIRASEVDLKRVIQVGVRARCGRTIGGLGFKALRFQGSYRMGYHALASP